MNPFKTWFYFAADLPYIYRLNVFTYNINRARHCIFYSLSLIFCYSTGSTNNTETYWRHHSLSTVSHLLTGDKQVCICFLRLNQLESRQFEVAFFAIFHLLFDFAYTAVSRQPWFYWSSAACNRGYPSVIYFRQLRLLVSFILSSSFIYAWNNGCFATP